MREYDAVFVGSGISSMVGAALLAKAGWSVCVLERNPLPGGCIRTDEITAPGFRHDLLSGWHPLFVGSAGYAELRSDLEKRGLHYLNTELPTASLYPDGRTAFLSRSLQANVDEFNSLHPGDGDRWKEAFQDFMSKSEIAFGIVGTELWSRQGLGLLWRGLRQLGKRGSLEFGAQLLVSARDWLSQTFSSPHLRGLLAPWVLHNGLGPDSSGSGFIALLIAAALQGGGMPIPKGGGFRLIEALAGLIEDNGGEVRCECDVRNVRQVDGMANGVALADGEVVSARRAVACCVTPSQLYLRLLEDADLPSWVREAARRFRHGRADMQIHMALSEPPRWKDADERLSSTAMIHLTPGLDAVSRAVNQAERGLLPCEATVVLGQPTALDPTRSPRGSWILWLQLQELPSSPIGDAAGRLKAEGQWTESLKEAYADRIIARLSRQIPNLESATLKRAVLSPADLQAANCNLVGGDPYAGSCALDQYFLWRPLPGIPHHRTPVKNLYHIGASTHPGPGLHGASGYMLANQLLAGG